MGQVPILGGQNPDLPYDRNVLFKLKSADPACEQDRVRAFEFEPEPESLSLSWRRV